MSVFAILIQSAYPFVFLAGVYVKVDSRITVSMSVCLYSCLIFPACKAHAPYYIAISGLCGSIIFFHIISLTERCSEEKKFEHKLCLSNFSTILYEIRLILKELGEELL
jgi:hypothetical protein